MRKPKEWGQPCPHPECTHHKRMQQGHVSAIAMYLTHSGKRRIFRCRTCATHVSATRETVFFRSAHLGRESHPGYQNAPGPG